MMNTSKNSCYASAPVDFSSSYSSEGLYFPLSMPPTLPNMDTPVSNSGYPPSMLSNVNIPVSDIGNIPPTVSSMELQMFDFRNIQPALPMMESPMLNITNGGVTLPNMETPMFDIANGVTDGSFMLQNNETPMFNIADGAPYSGGVALPDRETPISNNANGVPYGGSILPKMEAPMFNNTYGVPYSHITLPNMKIPMFDFVHENRGRRLGSKNKPRGEDSAMRSAILKVPAGTDIVGWVVAFAEKKNLYMVVQGGGVAVSEAHISFLGYPATPQVYKEQLTLLNFSGAYMFSYSKQGSATYFNASLSRKDGVVGGAASKIITMGEVILSASVFKNPERFKFKPELHKLGKQ